MCEKVLTTTDGAKKHLASQHKPNMNEEDYIAVCAKNILGSFYKDEFWGLMGSWCQLWIYWLGNWV